MPFCIPQLCPSKIKLYNSSNISNDPLLIIRLYPWHGCNSKNLLNDLKQDLGTYRPKHMMVEMIWMLRKSDRQMHICFL